MALHEYNQVGETDKDATTEAVWDDDVQHGPTAGDLQPTAGKIANSVDASQTATDVHEKATHHGLYSEMVGSQPSEVVTATTNTGSVGFGVRGCSIQSSADTDEAAIRTYRGTGNYSNTIQIVEGVASARNGWFSDHSMVGLIRNMSGTPGGAYFRLYRGEVVLGDGSASSVVDTFNGSNIENSNLAFRVAMDRTTNETHFRLRGAVNYENTFADTTGRLGSYRAVTRVNSTSTESELRVPWMKQTILSK